ncbi:MAG: triose-phosphate isomerase [Bacteroidota bacterium]|nr:triose-phosphate isomerase [Bacteroidota bacterium]
MRKKIVAGNWKMNNTLNTGIELAKKIDELVEKLPPHDTGIILGVPHILLSEVADLINSKYISVAAQNLAEWEKGAYTGEISAKMIKSTGAEYVLIGHSERRKYFNEEELSLHKKVNLALENGINPIYCCGEVLEERNSGKHFDIIKNQIKAGLFELDKDKFQNIIVAYEPVWAIGTGVTASSEQAQEMHKYIRKEIESHYGPDIAEDTTILYGGSCNPTNAAELFSNPDVDGGLIGGASLKAEDFISIITSF